jgi:transglutaminase-like putative cysteine protease
MADSPAAPRKGGLCSLLLAIVVVCAPHAQHLPVWVSIALTALVSWRLWLLWGDRRPPSKWLLLALAVSGTAGVLFTYGPLLGRDASVALLAVMTALKAMELRTQRDANVVLCLGYFLIITNFLYSQTILTGVFMLGVMAWLTATMVALQDRGGQLSPPGAVRTAANLLWQAAPIMAVLFVLFPRVQGPVFGFPQATSSAVTGLSERMSPGDLSSLGLSDEVAFRVQFQSPPPKPADLYWRGPVLWHFDGRTWTRGDAATPSLPQHEGRGESVRYAVTLEPHNLRWMFAIDLPERPPAGATLTSDYQILALRPVANRMRYEVSSHLTYQYGRTELPAVLQLALQVPRGFNPRSIELARSLRAQSGTDAQVVAAALNLFRTEPFFYTLVPPPLGRNSIDEFLFQTRRGFCEHYASAFVFLMRAAGIPARVVTGYQGGEMNPLGNYLIVRQSEAHAWAEIWLQDEGWVRVEPTAAVSPARVEVGIAAAVPRGEPLPISVRGDYPLLNRLRLGIDAAANSWNQWVLGYTPERQVKLLQEVGMRSPSWQSMAALLVGITAAVVLAIAVLVLLKLRTRQSDPVQRSWLRFCRKLGRLGARRDPGEGPLDFARRAAAVHPALADQIRAISELYVALRYAGAERSARELKSRVRAFRV